MPSLFSLLASFRPTGLTENKSLLIFHSLAMYQQQQRWFCNEGGVLKSRFLSENAHQPRCLFSRPPGVEYQNNWESDSFPQVRIIASNIFPLESTTVFLQLTGTYGKNQWDFKAPFSLDINQSAGLIRFSPTSSLWAISLAFPCWISGERLNKRLILVFKRLKHKPLINRFEFPNALKWTKSVEKALQDVRALAVILQYRGSFHALGKLRE